MDFKWDALMTRAFVFHQHTEDTLTTRASIMKRLTLSFLYFSIFYLKYSFILYFPFSILEARLAPKFG